MQIASSTFGDGKPRATWRRLSAAVGVVAAIGAGTVFAASPAHADAYRQSCATYHSWTECVSFDYTDNVLAVNATNGYSVAETEALWISVGSSKTTEGFDIPAGGARGFGIGLPGVPLTRVCGGIDTVQIVCTTFPTSP
jgi:hypothetical protein